MLTLNLGLEKSIILSTPHTWLLLLFVTILVIVYQIYKKHCFSCFQYVATHFNTIWYFFIMIVLTILTVYNYDEINYKDLSFASIIASALIILIFLPFFKRIGAFGFEAEIVSVLEKEVALNSQEKIMKIEKNSAEPNQDQIELLQKLRSLKAEVKAD